MQRTLIGLTLALFATPATWAAGDAAAGRIKSDTCLGCHGVASYHNVYPSYHVPKLSGQHAEYIVAALKGYKAGQRQHPTMQAQAATLSDQDIQDIATFWQAAGK